MEELRECDRGASSVPPRPGVLWIYVAGTALTHYFSLIRPGTCNFRLLVPKVMLLKYDDTPNLKLGLPHMGQRTGKNLHYYRFARP